MHQYGTKYKSKQKNLATEYPVWSINLGICVESKTERGLNWKDSVGILRLHLIKFIRIRAFFKIILNWWYEYATWNHHCINAYQKMINVFWDRWFCLFALLLNTSNEYFDKNRSVNYKTQIGFHHCSSNFCYHFSSLTLTIPGRNLTFFHI